MLIPPLSAPYVFHEYPMWIHREGMPSVVVNSAEEKDELLGVKPGDANDEDERAELFAQAKTAGIKVDKRWGTDRLREALA